MENHEEEEKKEEEGKQLSCAVSDISCDVANLGVISKGCRRGLSRER